MIRQLRRLRKVRLTRTGLCVVGAVSALATVLVIATALGKTSAQSQAIALLRRPRVERVVLPSRAAPPTPVATSTPAPAPQAVASTPATSAPSTVTTTSTTATTPKPTPVPSKVKHVFVIALTTTSYRAAFGSGSTMTYLDHVLRRKGDLLTGYETLGETDLPDYLAMVSGQGPNPDTERDCTTYASFSSTAAPDKAGEVKGRGCVYPDTVLTIGDQLDAARMGWKGYFEDMGSGLPAAQQTCQHPNSGAVDTTLTPGTTPTATTTTPTATTTTATTTTPTATATTPSATTAAENSYATSQNPFVYFNSLLDLGDCTSDDLPLTSLTSGLSSAAHTANLVYIAPALCDDGSESPCPGVTPTGVAGADAFLKQWVPLVLSSPAYRKNGALMIVFSSANTQLAGGQAFSHPIRTGALVISRYAKAGSTDKTRYTPYSVLRSIEDLFALKPLGHAKTAKSFATVALPGARRKNG
jgi:phosphatidylinositol-3-phosphatase